MPYSISGTTISVSGTVDLMNVSLPSIYRINFAAGGTNATFNMWNFMYVPPPGINFTVVGSASQDVLTIGVVEHGPPIPNGPPHPIEPSLDLSFFSFVNWGANDIIILKGNSDINYLSGSYENEILRGGNGNDTYDIRPNDIVDETGTDGVDTIISYASISLLGSNIRGDVENVVLTGLNTSATGNALSNRLTGSQYANILNGLAGDDLMQGKAGNDTYVVDTLNDIVDEAFMGGGGVDTVRSPLSYTLLDTVHVKGAVENLTLLGAALEAEGNALNNVLTGNGLANTIKGLGGNDVLSGGAGIDELQGGPGNDTYVLGSEASGIDQVVDSSGSADAITSLINRTLSFADYSEIENLRLLGNAVSGYGNGLSNIITGNARANGLAGFAGNDRLFGGAGNDILAGGAGNDIFVFNTALNSATNRDIVADFTHAQDKLWLDNAVMTRLGAGVHALSAAFFRAGPAAADANDYIVYNRAAGLLSYDADGNGHGLAIAFAQLTSKPLLTATDFLVM